MIHEHNLKLKLWFSQWDLTLFMHLTSKRYEWQKEELKGSFVRTLERSLELFLLAMILLAFA